MALTVASAAPKIRSGLGHHLRQTATFVVGKDVLVEGHGAALVPAFGFSIGTVVALGAAAALGAGLTEMEFSHQKKELRELYSEEIAAKLHKSAKKLTEQDLLVVAKGNQSQGIANNSTIAGAITKTRRQRNLGIVLAVVASLGCVSVILATAGPLAALGTIGAMAAKGAVGLLTYHAIREPLNWVGEKVFGLDQDTTHDRIVKLQKARDAGRSVMQEQVFSVMVSANPGLGDMIEHKFGRSYDKLGLDAQHQLSETLGKVMHVDHITASINAGRMNVTELAFVAEGQSSGVLPKDLAHSANHKGMLATVMDKLHQVSDRIAGKENSYQEAVANAVQKQEAQSTVSFTSRLNRSPASTMSHTARLQSREAALGSEPSL